MAGQQICLHAVRGVMEGINKEFTVKKKVTIGRTRVNAFLIKHDTVSQRHAYIAYKNGQWFVTDSDSSNGTSINGVFVTPSVPTKLRNGDLLGIGPENDVRVTINHMDNEGEEAEAGTRLEDVETSSQDLTLKEWFEQEKERLGDQISSMAEASVREVVESSETLKKKICEAAGVEFTSISLQAR